MLPVQGEGRQGGSDLGPVTRATPREGSPAHGCPASSEKLPHTPLDCTQHNMDDLEVPGGGDPGVFGLGHHCLVIVLPSSPPQPCCITVGDSQALRLFSASTTPPTPRAVVRLVALGSLSALPCALSQGGARWPRWLALSPYWVAVVCSSAEMTPHPQLHQSFHRWSESHCKMWLQPAPCAPLRGQLGQARLGVGADRALTWTREREAEARRGVPAGQGWDEVRKVMELVHTGRAGG